MSAAAGGTPGTLTKSLSMPSSIFLENSSSSAYSTSSPSPNSQTFLNNHNDLHPITKIMREQELGKLVLNLAVPITVALFLSAEGKPQKLAAYFILVGLMIGCMAIWNGILFRTTFPRLANVLEQVGIGLVLLLLYGLVATFLPTGFSYVLWLCGGLSLIPFIVSLLSYFVKRFNIPEI